MTAYLPVLDVPEMPDMTYQPTHPEYGTCPHCLQAKRITKSGLLPAHQTPWMVSPFGKATFHCPGGLKRYAEFGENGREWDLHKGEWCEMPVEIPVLVVADPRLEGKFPQWRTVEVYPTVSSHAHRQRLIKQDGWRIELVMDDTDATAVLLRLGDGAPVVQSVQEQARDGAEAMCRLVTMMLARIELAQDDDMAKELGTDD